jgi:hypothetical protein
MHESEHAGSPRVRTRSARRAIRLSESMALEFLDPTCSEARLDADFCFDSSDPYAVTVVFRSSDQQVCWTFARDLLVQGLHEPVGMGDVQLWPCLSESGTAVVVIELTSPDGTVLVQAPSRAVSLFVQRMLDVVPLGEESGLLDLDAGIATLFE